MSQAKWFDRKFDFDYSENIFPSIIERLSGTPVRLEEKIGLLSPEILAVRLDDKWSILENIGHLIDLEPLWQGRLDDFLAGKTELRPADLQNTQTHQAGHNTAAPADLLKNFRRMREETVARLLPLGEEIIFRTALHPRLKTPMRLMDSFLFVAEHDDHHLARITEISRRTLDF
ncbi:MAG: DinB family protein [Haliscomenobacteraceae bacterium CHB4]|nr:DinB family protein [Haliscomenobacteraceae bacterium CHB4]